MGNKMGIEAYIDVEEDKDIQEVAELAPETYKGLVADLAISKAEQSIIDEVTGVDGDDDESEEDELREERDMKTMFEQLYEIDPETKEVFVKGSAYDLKKWDEDMVCFTFGNVDRVIALESAVSPSERYLTKCFNKLTTKHTQLANIINQHSAHLRAKTISKSFAQDFKRVMGYPIPNVHMESFTSQPSSTNYSIAMEEMTGQQAALAAGAGLAGIAIIYKLIQWFAKSLNKNTLATSSITENIKAYSERKEMLKNMPSDMTKLKGNVDNALKELIKADNDNNTEDVNNAIAKLQQKFSQNDGEGAFDEAVLFSLQKKLKGKLTPFMLGILEANINYGFWQTLSTLVEDTKKAQANILASIDDIDKSFTTDKAALSNQNKNNYVAINELVFKLGLSRLVTEPESSITFTTAPNKENWSEFSSWFNATSKLAFTPYQNSRAIAKKPWAMNELGKIDASIFAKLDSSYVNGMTAVAERLKKHAEDATKKGKEASKENNIEKGDRAKDLMRLSKEFQYVSSIMRFVILARNDLGRLSVQLAGASEQSIGLLQRIGLGIGKAAKAPQQAVDKFKAGLDGQTK